MTVISAWWRLNIRFQRSSRRSSGRWVIIQLSWVWVPGQLPVEFQTVATRCGREGHTWPRGHSENPRCSCQQNSRQLETRCGREGHTRPTGPSESPDGVDPNIRRTRHNVTVITVGSKYEVYVRSPASSHMQTFRTLAIKWEVNMFVKKSSCVFLPTS